MKTFAIAAAALLAGSLAGMAHATTTAQNVYREVVSYADLNLETAADAAILHKRILTAARRVCGVYTSPTPLEISSPLRACAKDATARAIADVNATLLTRNIVVRNIAE
jgi:UrcA family protein